MSLFYFLNQISLLNVKVQSDLRLSQILVLKFGPVINVETLNGLLGLMSVHR